MSPQQGRRPLQSHTKHSIGKKSSVQVNPGSVVGFPESWGIHTQQSGKGPEKRDTCWLCLNTIPKPAWWRNTFLLNHLIAARIGIPWHLIWETLQKGNRARDWATLEKGKSERSRYVLVMSVSSKAGSFQVWVQKDIWGLWSFIVTGFVLSMVIRYRASFEEYT